MLSQWLERPGSCHLKSHRASILTSDAPAKVEAQRHQHGQHDGRRDYIKHRLDEFGTGPRELILIVQKKTSARLATTR
jgi:hypothetical protein